METFLVLSSLILAMKTFICLALENGFVRETLLGVMIHLNAKRKVTAFYNSINIL
jgi:hypothetical protein